MRVQFCPKCGVELREKARFCHKCGTKVKAPDTQVKKELEDPGTGMVVRFGSDGEMLCRRCSTAIKEGGGYLVCGEPCAAGRTADPMLLCDKCADDIFTERMWEETLGELLAEDKTVPSPTGNTWAASREAADGSIVARARKKGRTPEGARNQARLLAQLWWLDSEKALQRLRAE